MEDAAGPFGEDELRYACPKCKRTFNGPTEDWLCPSCKETLRVLGALRLKDGRRGPTTFFSPSGQD